MDVLRIEVMELMVMTIKFVGDFNEVSRLQIINAHPLASSHKHYQW